MAEKDETQTKKATTTKPTTEKNPTTTEKNPTTTETTETKTKLNFASPPWHAVAMLIAVLAICLGNIPSLESIDKIATLDIFTKSVFDDHDNTSTTTTTKFLGLIRIFMALICIGTTIYKFFEVYQLKPSYLPSSKLDSQFIVFHTYKTLFPFTSCAWNLLAIHFMTSGIIAFLSSSSDIDNNTTTFSIVKSTILTNPWFTRIALISYEIGAPSSLLVSFVVKYALWPRTLQANNYSKDASANLRSIPALLQHNANVFMVLIESCFLGGIPVVWDHIALAPLFGIIYVLFSWMIQKTWVNDESPQFIYFILDTTLGIMTTMFMLILLIVLLGFYAMFVILDGTILTMIDGGIGDNGDDGGGFFGGSWMVRLFVMVLVLVGLCRFRD